MSERDNDRERAVRFVDFGMEEAETTFDAGGPVSRLSVATNRFTVIDFFPAAWIMYWLYKR